MGKLVSDDNENLKYKMYLEERKILVDALREGARSFDKTILVLASGAFGLSLTFIKQISPNIKAETVSLLVYAWGGFCISILSTLISFLTSQNACSKQIQILEAEYLDNQNTCTKETTRKNKVAVFTYRLNILSILSFVAGVFFLAIFAISNLLL